MTRQIEALKNDAPALTGRRQRRANETRVRIFRAAMQLFAKYGPAQVTIEQITEAADVGKGTFFNYFETKDHVFAVLAEIQLAKMREVLSQAVDGRRSAHTVLRKLMLRMTEEPGRSPEMARTILTSFLASSQVREMVSGFLLMGRHEVARVIAYGQERGEIDQALNARKVALQLQLTIFGTLLLWSLNGDTSLSSLVEDSFQLFWRAVAVSK